jgi:hypothetical protein
MKMDPLAYLDQAIYPRWDPARARDWQEAGDWLLGCNFIPSNAINQLEMWQEETFSPAMIDRELGWLAGLGMNSVRVFLHNLLWEQDAAGFLKRVEHFLEIAHRHGIGAMLVFFDSCWDPEPVLGRQRGPRPGVHNSYWVKSPAVRTMTDPAAFHRLEEYVTSVVGHFRDDRRVHAWDVWNEPDNFNQGFSANGQAFPAVEMAKIILPLLAKSFDWVRAGRPSQPVTSGVWQGDWSSDEKMAPLHRFQVLASDVVSFHCYKNREEALAEIEPLRRFERPLMCTEYLARGMGNTFQAILPWFKEQGIHAYNWGSVSGKTQTIYPWDSWQKPYAQEPPVWHHDIFRADGSPYDPEETALIRSLTRG